MDTETDGTLLPPDSPLLVGAPAGEDGPTEVDAFMLEAINAAQDAEVDMSNPNKVMRFLGGAEVAYFEQSNWIFEHPVEFLNGVRNGFVLAE